MPADDLLPRLRAPEWVRGVPICTEHECPQYDGKRCKEMGFRPGTLCEPEVRAMGARLEAAEACCEAAEVLDDDIRKHGRRATSMAGVNVDASIDDMHAALTLWRETKTGTPGKSDPLAR